MDLYFIHFSTQENYLHKFSNVTLNTFYEKMLTSSKELVNKGTSKVLSCYKFKLIKCKLLKYQMIIPKCLTPFICSFVHLLNKY